MGVFFSKVGQADPLMNNIKTPDPKWMNSVKLSPMFLIIIASISFAQMKLFFIHLGKRW